VKLDVTFIVVLVHDFFIHLASLCNSDSIQLWLMLIVRQKDHIILLLLKIHDNRSKLYYYD